MGRCGRVLELGRSPHHAVCRPAEVRVFGERSGFGVPAAATGGARPGGGARAGGAPTRLRDHHRPVPVRGERGHAIRFFFSMCLY